MKSRSPRAGDAVRVVLLFVCIFLAVPILLVSLAFLGWRTTAARAEDLRQQAVVAETLAQQAAADRARQDAERTRRAVEVGVPASEVLRPVIETQYQDRSFTVETPYKDPQTGEMKVRKSVQHQMVPVQVQRFERSQFVPTSDSAVPRLVQQLLELNEEDEEYDGRLKELRQRLDLEFSGMHESQAKEIAATEERLDSLKKLHRERGENRDKIVQRRIDELLGRTDAFEWEVKPNQNQMRGYSLWPGDRYVPTVPSPNSVAPFAQPNGGTFQPDLTPPRSSASTPSYSAPTPTQPQPGLPPHFPPQAPQPYGPPRLPNATTPPSPMPMNPGFQVFPPPASLPAPTSLPPGDLLPPGESRQIERVEERVFIEGPTPGKLDAAGSAIGRIFELARKWGAAESQIASAESELAQMNNLRQQGAVTSSEYEKMKAHLSQIRRELALSQLEFQAIGESFRRSQKVAETQLENTLKALEIAKARFDQGTAPTTELNRAEGEAINARARLEEAIANLQQLDQAISLVRDQDSQDSLNSDADANSLRPEASTDGAGGNEQEIDADDETGSTFESNRDAPELVEELEAETLER